MSPVTRKAETRSAIVVLAACLALFAAMHRFAVSAARADDAPAARAPAAAPEDEPAADSMLDLRELIQAGGAIGVVILLLSVAMLALVVEHALSIRRAALLPAGLAEAVHQHLVAGNVAEARRAARESESFLGGVLDAGLAEADLGYETAEKAMEDAALARASLLYRKIEYLSVIGTIAPMLGLLGTVWGMIGAFLAFETKANPQVSELAPGIYRALVTTLFGLGVAIPALAGYGVFRNRIEALTDEGTQLADHVFADFKRADARRRSERRKGSPAVRRAPETEART